MTSIKMHSVESRLVIEPSNVLFGSLYVCTFQPGNFTGWGSEGVNVDRPCVLLMFPGHGSRKVSEGANMLPNFHPTLPLVDLHWLPVERKIECKISRICYNVITSTAPLYYFSDLHELYIPSCTLRSSTDNRIFFVPNRQ